MVSTQQPAPARRMPRTDAMSISVVLLHVAALLIFLFDPKTGAIVLGVGIALALGFSRPFALMLVVLTFLWINDPLSDFFPNAQYTAWKDVVLVLVGLGWLVRTVLLHRPIALNHPTAKWMLLVIGFFLASCVLSASGIQALLGLKNTCFYMTWLFVLPEIVQTKKDARSLLVAIFVGTLLLSAYCVWRLGQPVGTFPPQRDGKILDGVMKAHFSSGNIFLGYGVLLAIAVAPAFAGWRRWLVMLVALVGLVPIVGSLERNTWVGLGLALIAMTVVSRRTEMVKALVFALVASAALQSSLNLKVADRAASSLSGDDNSRQVRASEANNLMLPFIYSHPFGGGTGSMTAVASAAALGGVNNLDLVLQGGLIHNGFELVAIETGWLGLAAYVGMLASGMLCALHSFRTSHDPFVRSLALGLMAVILFYTVLHFGAPMITYSMVNYDIWILLGLVTLLPRFDAEKTPAKEALRSRAAVQRRDAVPL